MDYQRRHLALIEAEEREQEKAINGSFNDRVRYAIVREIMREMPGVDGDHLLRGTTVYQKGSGVIEISVPANLDELLRRRRIETLVAGPLPVEE